MAKKDTSAGGSEPTPLENQPPYEDFEFDPAATNDDIMNWVAARLDDGAKSVELFRRVKQGKRVLIGRVWWRNA